MTADLLALAARCEAAGGGSLVLDGEIWCAVRGLPFVKWDGAGAVYRHVDGVWKGSVGHIPASEIRPYSVSLDAALSLVPEHGVVMMMTCYDGIVGGHAWVWASSSPTLSYHDRAAKALSTEDRRMTLPLALCAAALRARAALSPIPAPPDGVE